ncbi:MAG TPA: class I SAM-dependent methyltransferase, partial [Propionibacteriaceae bacterium]|nr:class I SAM-dependent methyltransferase [Propionibacteriaceae bacterium]
MNPPRTTKASPSIIDARSWAFAEDFVPSTEAGRQAHAAAAELGVPPLTSGTASVLTFLATAISAQAVVEVGTGSGASGVALFAGMTPEGILTSIDTEAERQAEARRTFTGAGIPSRRFRLIAGVPLEVLPKLRDGAYDLVFIDGDK